MALRSITIPVPPALEQRLRPYQDRLPELLERGIDVLAAEDSAPSQDESTILEVLTSNPTPAQILALRPSPKLQTRASELLARSKRDELSRQEETELDRCLVLEHLVRLAKSRAAQHLAQMPEQPGPQRTRDFGRL